MTGPRYRRFRLVQDGAGVEVHEWRPDQPRGECLFLHGMGANTGYVANELVAGLVVEDRLRLLAPDLPGFGASEPVADAGYGGDRLADWTARLLTQLDIARVLLVGHSWGGYIGCHVAATHPDRVAGLALLDGGHEDLPAAPAAALARAALGVDRWFSFDSFDKLRTRCRNLHGTWSDTLERVYAGATTTLDGRVVLRQRPTTAVAIRAAAAAAPVSSQYHALRTGGCPVLLLVPADAYQAQDRRAVLDAFRAALPAARIHQIAAASHHLPHEAGAVVTEHIREWLRSVSLRGGTGPVGAGQEADPSSAKEDPVG